MHNEKKILICDDDKDIADVTSIILEESGFKVKTLYSCETIFETIEIFTPDLILMDLRIPKKGGEAITRELKANDKTKNIPVLIFSANHKAVQIAENVGADGFIGKPFDIDVLVSIIKHHLR